MKSITPEQREKMMAVIIEQIDRELRHCQKCLGSPEYYNYEFEDTKYEVFAIFTHAVEELGKYVYFYSRKKNKSGNYNIENYIFKNHNLKFELARKILPIETLKVAKGSFDSKSFSSDFSIDTEPTWDNRVDVLNVDLDDQGNPKNIKFDLDIDELRKSVWDMRNDFPYNEITNYFLKDSKHQNQIEEIITKHTETD